MIAPRVTDVPPSVHADESPHLSRGDRHLLADLYHMGQLIRADPLDDLDTLYGAGPLRSGRTP